MSDAPGGILAETQLAREVLGNSSQRTQSALSPATINIRSDQREKREGV